MNATSNFNLVALIENDLGQGHKSGRWTQFHCPFPGHTRGDKKPSLSVTLGDGTRPPGWKCFTCGKSGDAIAWVMQYRGVTFKEAVKALGGETYRPGHNQPRPEPPVQRADNPPAEIWKVRAMQLIERAETALWDGRGQNVLDWLHARGLNDATIRAARLGYIAANYADKPEMWGSPNADSRPLYFFKGLLIPGLAGGKVWYLKMRPEHPRDGQKYKHVRGGKQALYRAETLQAGMPAVFCEGELDALLLGQEVGDLARVVTLASATAELNVLTWGLYLMPAARFLFAYDMDKAGNEGAKKLAWLRDSSRLHIPALRKGDKDVTDFHKSGGNLKSLVESALREDAPIFVQWLSDANPATIRGQYWQNPNQRIEAYYLPAELEQCLETMKAIAELEIVQA